MFGRPPEELTARLAYIDFDGASALTAVSDFPPERGPGQAFLDTHCAKVLEGIERLCDWLDK